MKILKTSASRFALYGVLIFCSTTLSGCMTDTMDAEEAMIQPAAYGGSDNYPISVVKGPITLEVDSSAGSLNDQQINAIMGFAHQAMQAGVTPVTISRPSGGGSSARVASEVANLVSQQGLSRKKIRVITYPAPAGSPVNVSYISTYARTKECGQHLLDASETAENTMMSNHGCAVQANIAAMLANPGTLVSPAPSSSIRANTRVSAIKGLERDTSRDKAPWWTIFN
jgi:pilus assembly protein CpaD